LRARHLRQLYSTTLRNKGIPKEMIDLLQGRIGQSIFTRFYYKPFLKEIQTKTLEAIKPLQEELFTTLKQ
jgi:intergrase/recombinase